MLLYVIRRLLWAVPTLFGVSLVVFLLTTLMPDPQGIKVAEEIALSRGDYARLDELTERRRELFLDLPRFFNDHPADVRSRAAEALAQLVANAQSAPLAAHRLERLGGAALPFVLPELERLPPDAQGRVALWLAPLGERMRVASSVELRDPARAASIWMRFWEDHALDFTGPAVRRAVRRVVVYGTALRERELLDVDTFALRDLVEELGRASDPQSIERLMRLAQHISGRGMAVAPGTDDASVALARADWQNWWFVHQDDYVVLSGVDRITAMLGETRYSKWIVRTLRGRLGVSIRDGQPIAPKLRARAGTTILLTSLALLASFAIAVPLGVVAAWRQGRASDLALAMVLFALYALPTFWAAQTLARLFSTVEPFTRLGVTAQTARLALAAFALTLTSMAALSRYQRSAMLEVVRQDYVRTARAKGVSSFRLLVVHALRNALMPTITAASMQMPTLLGGALVVEEIFELPGLGYETLRAVESHDISWLMATILFAAVLTIVMLLVSDLLQGWLDPRVQRTPAHRTRASA